MEDTPTTDSTLRSPPSHPGICIVEINPGSFASRLVAEKSFTNGETISHLEGLTKGPKAYSTVQCGIGEEDHVELNSDLLYMNHSCEPNVFVDVSSPDRKEWNVRAARDIKPGDGLCFFYPSTEWNMDQPFECNCNSQTCLGKIQGAKHMTREELSRRGFINNHIWELVKQRELREH